MKYFNNITTFEQAKLHYRKLAKQLHPDRGGSAQEFQKMQSEYKSLLLQLQSKELVSNPENSEKSNEIINELTSLAKTLIQKDIPQRFIKQIIQKSESPIERVILNGVVDILNNIK